MSDRDAESTGYTTDDQAGMENLSVMNDAGLTDAEGALSDVNSLLNDGIPVGDFDLPDDTSLSSRASSRFFDSEPMLSLESFGSNAVADFISSKLSGDHRAGVLYDSEYDNYGPSSLASDDLYDDDSAANGSFQQMLAGGGGSEDKIRRVSQHITRSFGQSQRRPSTTTEDSDEP